jgi:hypothetical protein
VLGKMQDELNGQIMPEFITLDPKMYSYQKLHADETYFWTKEAPLKCSKELSFNQYRDYLYIDKIVMPKFY